MLHRLVVLIMAVTLATGAALVAGSALGPIGGPTHVLAAGGNGVGSSTTGATGNARACQATAANNGKSNANGLQCSSLTVTATCTNGAAFTFTGSGLVPGDLVWFYYQPAGPGNSSWVPVAAIDPTNGTVAPDGTYSETLGLAILPAGTVTVAAFAPGVTPNGNATTTTNADFLGTSVTYNCAQ